MSHHTISAGERIALLQVNRRAAHDTHCHYDVGRQRKRQTHPRNADLSELVWKRKGHIFHFQATTGSIDGHHIRRVVGHIPRKGG